MWVSLLHRVMHFRVRRIFAVFLCFIGSTCGLRVQPMSCSDVSALINRYFNCTNGLNETMMCIAYFASGYDPGVRDPSGAVGLFLIPPKYCGQKGCPEDTDDCIYVRS